MAKSVIQVENLSKAYQIGQIGSGTLSKDIERFWQTKVLGNEDPFLKIGETNDRSKKGSSNIVWSLKDINFEVNQGDAVGIIGKNGAGKSTLLKLLSRVTSPTTGEMRIKGRIASLLEVGTGFHPELSGRENIFLNGAILGMRKKEIANKLDEIIDFSGVERYIDTPVKRYSSGMYVRLAFAVAAHLESEILIVDEVLAVGDAEFQKKCLGKMGDISKGEGRTVLFVSHNMSAVKSLCNNGIVLTNGKIKYFGSTENAINEYLIGDLVNQKLIDITERSGNKKVLFETVKVFGNDETMNPITGGLMTMEFEIQNYNQFPSNAIRFDMRIDDNFGQRLVWLSTSLKQCITIENAHKIIVNFDKTPLEQGIYFVTIYLAVNNEDADLIENAFSFTVEEGTYFKQGSKIPEGQSKVLIDFNINYQ
jgi:lipopolysaccharide transport system ATP-binding protein